MNPDIERFHEESEITLLVKRFESCEFKPNEFRHADHLTVALWYLAHLSKPVAVERMRCELKKFTAFHQVNGYHETLTLFWMELISAFLSEEHDSVLFHQTANRLINKFPSSKVVYDFYSKQVLDSLYARANWVEPDLRTLTGQ